MPAWEKREDGRCRLESEYTVNTVWRHNDYWYHCRLSRIQGQPSMILRRMRTSLEFHGSMDLLGQRSETRVHADALIEAIESRGEEIVREDTVR
jgi:hypothetical protein